MKNILQALYYGRLNEFERNIKKLQETQQYKEYDKCYKKLVGTLTPEQKNLFEEYFQSESIYLSLENEQIYANGVKTGMCLALELIDFDPIVP